MVEEYQQNPVNSLLAEFSTRLNEVEEKQRLIKDRILLIGENLISTKEDSIKQDSDIKKELREIRFEIKTLKQLMSRVIDELPNLARKTELEILENQARIFQPLEFARIKDVQEIVKKEIKKLEKRNKT